MASAPGGNRRVDARRSRASILDAAIRELAADPERSVEAIAAAAGVTRQTVYAHFRSRDELLAAVLREVTDAAVAELDAIDLDAGSATDALLRLLEASARITSRHRPLFRLAGALPVAPEEDRRRHAPAVGRLQQVIMRGQGTGEFDDRLAPGWLAAVVVQVGHVAGAEVEADRMTPVQAVAALRTSVLRLLGAPG
jgi:AcrR family transcriptional regulator